MNPIEFIKVVKKTILMFSMCEVKENIRHGQIGTALLRHIILYVYIS